MGTRRVGTESNDVLLVAFKLPYVKGPKVPIPFPLLLYAKCLSNVVFVFQCELGVGLLFVENENEPRLELLVKDINGHVDVDDSAEVALEFLNDLDRGLGFVVLVYTFGCVLDSVLVQRFQSDGETVDPLGVAHRD